MKPIRIGAVTLALAITVAACGAGPTAGRLTPSTTPGASLTTPPSAAPQTTTSVPLPIPSATIMDHWARTTPPAPGLVYWFGARFILFGSERRIWASTDGSTWSRLADLPGGSGVVRDVAAGARTHVAVGSRNPWPRAGVWTSADGLSWNAVPDQASLHGAEMYAVTAGAGGFVAVGAVGMRTCGSADRATGVVLLAACGVHGAIWWSPDGQTWSRIEDSAAFAERLFSVAAGPFGYVASSNDDYCRVCYLSGPPFFVSPDGRSWRLEDPSAVKPARPGYATSVAFAGADVVAVGYGDAGNLVWSSADGEHWASRVFPVIPALGSFTDVTSLPNGGVVAVGPGIAGSADGITWTQLLSPDEMGEVDLSSVACGPARCVAMGRSREDPGQPVSLIGPALGTR